MENVTAGDSRRALLKAFPSLTIIFRRYTSNNDISYEKLALICYDVFHDFECSECKVEYNCQKYEEMIRKYPFGIFETAPIKSQLIEFGADQWKSLLDKWTYDRRKLRETYVIEMFPRRVPTEGEIRKLADKKGWRLNPNRIMKKWESASTFSARHKTSPEVSVTVRSHIESQLWPGIEIQIETRQKGRSLIATKRFKASEIICDYHGIHLSEQEGKKRFEAIREGEPCYMCFFRNPNDGKSYYINAQDPCPCHSHMASTFGRIINHTRKRPNIRPQLFRLNENKVVILFKAIRDITPGEEILFDYGVTRKSFGGEGLELEWLDY